MYITVSFYEEYGRIVKGLIKHRSRLAASRYVLRLEPPWFMTWGMLRIRAEWNIERFDSLGAVAAT